MKKLTKRNYYKDYVDLTYNFYLQDINGLCEIYEVDERDELFELMRPSKKENAIKNRGYWAKDENSGYEYRFNGLRQNIVLLMAAMNGDLK